MRPSSIGGYILLISLAILAPTPLPVPLDGIILALIAKGFNPRLVLMLAIIGDLIGTFIIFKVGKKSRDLLTQYKKRRKRKDYVLAENLFKKYGKYSLIFGGVPFLGDALIFISGFYKLNIGDFFLYFILGKGVWYTLLALGVHLF